MIQKQAENEPQKTTDVALTSNTVLFVLQGSFRQEYLHYKLTEVKHQCIFSTVNAFF